VGPVFGLIRFGGGSVETFQNLLKRFRFVHDEIKFVISFLIKANLTVSQCLFYRLGQMCPNDYSAILKYNPNRTKSCQRESSAKTEMHFVESSSQCK
jgi:hypothetical protein